MHSAGYAPFDFIGDFDHRGLYFDIILDEIQAMPHRRLKSSIPKRVQKYLDVVSKQWTHQNIDHRMEQVKNSFNKNLSHKEKMINELDKSITNLLKHAEKKYSRAPKDSNEKAIQNLNECRGLRNKAQYVQPTDSLVDAVHLLRQRQQQYENAYLQYRQLRGRDFELRIEYLKQMAEDKALENKSKATAELKKLLRIEEQRCSNVKIKYVTKPHHRDGVTSILIPTPDEYETEYDKNHHYDVNVMWKRIHPNSGRDVKNWERITNKDIIERMLLEWQQLHFLQANGTPFTTPDRKEKLDSEDFHQEVLDDEYVPPDSMHPLIKDVLAHIRRPEYIDEFEFVTTYDEFVDFIKKSKERTSTSPSGHHYGHYKSLLQGLDVYLRTIHAILELTLQNNVILKRWKSTVTTLIEKDRGSPCIHRMREIHIIESEVHFISKVFYVKKMMLLAECNHLITDEQYGGRNRRQAQSAVINKVLYYNLSR